MVFVHVPKTGGTYIESLFGLNWNESHETSKIGHLKNLYGIYEDERGKFTLQHLTAEEIRLYFKDEVGDKSMFSVVRNPFERAVSLYHDHKEPLELSNFVDFLLLLDERGLSYDFMGWGIGDYYDQIKYHLIPQSDYIFNSVGGVPILLKYENSNQVNRFLKELGIENPIFGSPRDYNYYKDYLNEKTISLISRIYHVDFVRLFYSKMYHL